MGAQTASSTFPEDNATFNEFNDRISKHAQAVRRMRRLLYFQTCAANNYAEAMQRTTPPSCLRSPKCSIVLSARSLRR
jgi:glutathionylspermidine synthase